MTVFIVTSENTNTGDRNISGCFFSREMAELEVRWIEANRKFLGKIKEVNVP